MNDPLVTISEAHRLLRISRATLYRLLAAKNLTIIKLGRRSLIRRAELDRFIDGLTGSASSETGTTQADASVLSGGCS
jgi:excisionase family DNA binding protein